ncbi:MAG TPA: hypothetical protein ENN87_13805 [Phycisphaerales bacterium]|nr:hypothetical protein [Phycisphaerales bacterium]
MSGRIEGDRRLAVTAGAASVGVHILILAAFGTVRWGRAPAEAGANVSPPAVAQIQQLLERPPITSKPKTRPIFDAHRLVPAGRRPADLTGIGKIEMDASADLQLWQGTDEALAPSRASGQDTGVSFFGQATTVRKICYVVDATGSMHGRFGLVKQQLTDSIRRLDPDQYFYIIFFLDGDRLLETGGGRLVRATPAAKAQAEAFIDAVRPSGATNAVAALRRGMEIRDALGQAPQLIYFLTDGFDLGETVGIDDFVARIEQTRRQLAPHSRVHTIGFWTESGDVEILKRLAEQSGGVFTHVQ